MVFTKGHKIWLGKNHSKKSREKMSRDHIGERNPMLLSKKEHSDLHRNKSGQFSKGGN